MNTVIGHVTHDEPWTYTAVDGTEVTVPAGTWSVLDCPAGHIVPDRHDEGTQIDHTCEVTS